MTPKAKRESERVEHTKIDAGFRTKRAAVAWCALKFREGFEITGPFRNPFAYSNEHPWEVVAKASTSLNPHPAPLSFEEIARHLYVWQYGPDIGAPQASRKWDSGKADITDYEVMRARASVLVGMLNE